MLTLFTSSHESAPRLMWEVLIERARPKRSNSRMMGENLMISGRVPRTIEAFI